MKYIASLLVTVIIIALVDMYWLLHNPWHLIGLFGYGAIGFLAALAIVPERKF